MGVLGCGIDVVYPRSNRRLVRAEFERTGLLSPSITWARLRSPGGFPARNRIIAGLGDVLVVVEAAEKSGALITARHALDSGRDVWAVPGPTWAYLECRGSNKLLADGAGVLWDIPEFAEAIVWSRESPKERVLRQRMTGGVASQCRRSLPGNEARRSRESGSRPTSVDVAAGRSGLEMPVHELLSALALLELKGYVARTMPELFVRRAVAMSPIRRWASLLG